MILKHIWSPAPWRLENGFRKMDRDFKFKPEHERHTRHTHVLRRKRAGKRGEGGRERQDVSMFISFHMYFVDLDHKFIDEIAILCPVLRGKIHNESHPVRVERMWHDGRTYGRRNGKSAKNHCNYALRARPQNTRERRSKRA